MADAHDISIIRAGVDDAPRIAPLFDQYRQFYAKPSDPAAALAFLNERLGAEESVVYLAMTSRGDGPEPAGFIQLFPSFSSVSLCRAWILNDLFVGADCRKLGVGRALMDRARQHCLETGARQLWLQTDLTNATAQRLYDGVGMTRKEILEYTWTP